MAPQQQLKRSSSANDAEERPSKVIRSIGAGPSDFASVITVIVGPEGKQKTFVLHERLLRQSSDFFDNAWKPEWKGADDRTVTMTDTNPWMFAVYARFLLTGFLFIRPDIQTSAANEVRDKKYKVSKRAACMYLLELANFLQAPDFRDAIVDAMIEDIAELRTTKASGLCVITPSDTRHIYTLSATDSPIRSLVVDLNLRAWPRDEHGKQFFSDCPPEYLRDFSRAAARYILLNKTFRHTPDPLNITNSCKYHEHTLREEPCYRKRHLYLPKSTEATAAQATQSTSGSGYAEDVTQECR